jgi:hypothetical protein
MRPTAQECARARDLGGQARRAGHKADANPHRNGVTDKDRILAEAWQAGFDSGKKR